MQQPIVLPNAQLAVGSYRAALRLGMLHGVDCLGCCAGLMVGLVAVGMMNLAWMLTAALIIFAEKTLPNSHRIARPLGVVMVGVVWCYWRHLCWADGVRDE